MRFIVIKIENEQKDVYDLLSDALRVSIIKNTVSTVEFHDVHNATGDVVDTEHYRKYIGQTIKLRAWNEIVQKYAHGEHLCLIDADTVVLKDVSHVFNYDFDICYTRREEHSKILLNTGVLFVKVSQVVKDFFHQWTMVNEKMQTDEDFHKKWHPKYHGMDQTSFGYMLENNPVARTISLPCDMYNACTISNWENINEKTHILHIKAQLREACLGKNFNVSFPEAVQEWKKYGV